LILAIVALMVAAIAFAVVKLRPMEARVRQLEKQVAVDSRAFAHQARLHNQRIAALDERLQYMAREMRSERPTPLRPPAP